MPRDRFDVARMFFGALLLLTFALVGLNERLHSDRHGHAVERPATHRPALAPATVATRWP